MDYEGERVRMNVEGDRLSSLPDDLIQKIFSLIGTKHAVQTSVLSYKWRFMWTSMACLDFSNVSSVKLSFRGKASQVFVKKILNYAFSHNVQQLTVTCLLDKKIVFPLSLFSSETLKHLYLVGSTNDNVHSITPTSTWELPALTTLHLDHVTLYDNNADNCAGLFSKCTNLMDLTLSYCNITTSNSFTICHPQLSNLSLENGDWGFKCYECEGFTSLETLELCIDKPDKADAHKIVGVLQLFNYVKTLNLSLEIIYREGFPSLETLELCIDKPDKADAHKIVGVLQLFNYVKTLNLSLEIIYRGSFFIHGSNRASSDGARI
ncbi:F-box domain, Leucine-rich repeat domain, L domain-like protein [Artemisia annua]|uniref:F-box domain, Leucine-rich repeat domain, L domain-like protein n=1 Tax=Artemisia annua TaxID=35608 RepID=A0A2U1NCE1_ARTAN|nr:F-box domain, Leucine-rich repeat domain, L domain-like protein [Artemisia annua]